MKIHRLLIMGSATAALMLLSCNLFAPSEANREQAARDGGPYALTYEAKLIMYQKTPEAYRKAIRLFDEALSEDSSISEALYYKGKCILRLANIDITQVWSEINPGEQNEKTVPFLYKPVPIFVRTGTIASSADSLCRNDSIFYKRHYGYAISPYTLNGNTALTVGDSVYLERKRLYEATCPALKMLDYINSKPLDGMIIRKQYESDYLVESSIKSLLGIIDMNNNDTLDYAPSGSPKDEQVSFRVLSSDIKNLDTMNLDSLKTISRDPKQINEKLAVITATVGKAKSSYDSLNAEIKRANKDTSMISGIGGMLTQFYGIVPFYYYDDYQDNNSNWYNTDSVWGYQSDTIQDTALKTFGDPKDRFADRMIWIDWDGDGLIDVNPPGVSPHTHIGSPAHRVAHPEWYENVGTQSSSNHRYKYKGPYTYEFIFGDWGIDEEIMDGDDNTFDGLTDEDTRITDDTLDDDGDGRPGNPNKPVKMVWMDLNNDFMTNILFSASDSMNKTNKYAVIAHLPRLANSPNVLKTTKIPSFTGASTGEFNSGDYGIDEEWYDGIDNDGDGLIDEDIALENVPEQLRGVLIRKLTSTAITLQRPYTYHTYLHYYWETMQGAK